MPSLACLNGNISAPEDAKVSIWDRGFLFGDAVYEVCRIYQGRCWLEAEHMARLRRSLHEMRMGGIDLDLLNRRMHDTIKKSGIGEGTIYVQITRGVAPRQHAFPDASVAPTELIVVRPYDDSKVEEKRRSGVSVVTRPELRWGRCDVKSTNLLANVIAFQEATERGAAEAVLVEPDGMVTEASHSSLLWVRNGFLEGTPEGPGILPGTTRLGVLRLSEEAKVPFREANVSLDELKRADEVLLTGTTIEVMPVVTVDDETIGSGTPGPVTRKLQEAFRKAIERWLAPVLA